MTKTLKLGLIIIFLVQLLVAGGFELAHDEAYYWLYSQNLAWGYFDHPPLVGVAIRMFSFLPHAEWSLRLPFILMQFASLGILFRLLPISSWAIASWLFFAFPLASFSGILAIPDMPLLLTAALYCLGLKRFLEKNDIVSVLGLSLAIPLMLYAKYHGVLLVFFTILAIPKLLLKKEFYLIALISILLFLPHVWWQYQHDFSTLRYHFLERPSAVFQWKRSLEYLGIQLILSGMLVGPLVWWISGKFKAQNEFDRCMKFIAFGTVIFFLISSFSKKVEANWTITLAVPLIYLAASSHLWKKKWAHTLLLLSFGMVFFARFVLVLSPTTFNLKRLHEFHGWKQWAHELSDKCGKERTLMANSYQIASKLSYYLEQDVQALNFHSRKNQFDFWKFDSKYTTNEVCYLTDKQEFQGEPVLALMEMAEVRCDPPENPPRP